MEAVAAANAGLDDTLDDIRAEVEAAIAADNTLSGYAWRVDYLGTERELTGEHAVDVGVAAMSFAVRYATAADDPTDVLTH